MIRVGRCWSRVVLVGELNPYGGSDENALVPWPRGCAGHRLMQVLALREETYLGLGRTNLCRGKWSAAEARDAVELISGSGYGVVVLLGRRVASAFGYRDEFFTYQKSLLGRRATVSLPHPSGRCPLWNFDHNRAAARMLLAGLAPEVPWGEALDDARGPLYTRS